MTQNKKIQDLLYFKGIIDNYDVKIKTTNISDFNDNLKIIVSVLS